MRRKTLIAVIAIAILGASTAAMGKGGGGGGGKGGAGAGGAKGGAHFGHTFFGRAPFHARFDRRFPRNQFLLGGGWGWGGGDWGWPSGGYSTTNVVVYPQAIPMFASGSVAATPCHWNEETFKVPSVIGGTEEVSVVSCR